MDTPYPQPLVQLAGTRRVLESAHKLVGGMWGEEGTTRAQHAWTADPDLIRALDTGQACYIHRGGPHSCRSPARNRPRSASPRPPRHPQ